MTHHAGRHAVDGSSLKPSRADRNFHLAVALVVAAVVVAGFGPTANERLLHRIPQSPPILYVHAVLFTAWVALFIIQSALVRSRKVAWHRRLGYFGLAMGACIPFVGFGTALTMTRLSRSGDGTGGESFLIVSLFDMLAFAITFGLAMFWRRRPDYHRRLLVMSSCGLTVAAFARLPGWLVPDDTWYLYVDLLIFSGVVRDWLVMRRIHPVYRLGLPALMLGQAATMWIYRSDAPFWVAIAQWLLR
jgi:hypothetical protein